MNDQVSAWEARFREIREMDLPLGERLRFLAEDVRIRAPQFAEAVDVFVYRLEAAEAGKGAPQVGEPMPPFIMPDQDGKLVSLDQILSRGPAVIAIHRGHWCPYCRMNMAGLAEIQHEVAPGQIYAISPELQKYTNELRRESGARFPFLTDVDAGYTLSLNLAVWVDDLMAGMIAGAAGDIPTFHGSKAWIIPIPAVFIVDREGIIRTRHVDPDYRTRMELDTVVSGVCSLP